MCKIWISKIHQRILIKISQFKALVKWRILVDDCDILLLLIPLKIVTLDLKSPALRKSTKDSTPESAT